MAYLEELNEAVEQDRQARGKTPLAPQQGPAKTKATKISVPTRMRAIW